MHSRFHQPTSYEDWCDVRKSCETTTGGNALKFYASIRLDIRRISALKDGEDVTVSRVRVKVVKKQIAAPFKQAEFDVDYGQGVNKCGEILDLAAAKILWIRAELGTATKVSVWVRVAISLCNI